MKHFLVKKDTGNDYSIIKVKDEDVASFQKEFEGKILFVADSTQELLIQFNEDKRPMQA